MQENTAEALKFRVLSNTRRRVMKAKKRRKVSVERHRKEVEEERANNKKEGELKATEVPQERSRARKKPLSILSNKMIREDANKSTPTPGLSDFIRKKYGSTQTDDNQIRKAPPNRPDLAFPGSIEK